MKLAYSPASPYVRKVNAWCAKVVKLLPLAETMPVG